MITINELIAQSIAAAGIGYREHATLLDRGAVEFLAPALTGMSNLGLTAGEIISLLRHSIAGIEAAQIKRKPSRVRP